MLLVCCMMSVSIQKQLVSRSSEKPVIQELVCVQHAFVKHICKHPQNTEQLNKVKIMVSVVGCVNILEWLHLYHTHTVASVPFIAQLLH